MGDLSLKVAYGFTVNLGRGPWPGWGNTPADGFHFVRFRGALRADSQLIGTVVDPDPTYDPTPVLSGTPCVYRAVGLHT